jgi:hypothetical protein
MTSRDTPDDLFEVSEAMVRAGVAVLREEPYATSHEELVDLIYSAMEYQRRREVASRSTSSR